jgi:hypothetical protein
MATSRANWSEAFAAQASSDLDAFLVLEDSGLPVSHRLHYLQMWLEKLCKAYLWMQEDGADERLFKHNVIVSVLPHLVSKYRSHLGITNQLDLISIRQLCREIDLLHPQVDDDGRRPENVEYPWMGNLGKAEVPARWRFTLTRRLYSNPGRQLLKAASILTRNASEFIR